MATAIKNISSNNLRRKRALVIGISDYVMNRRLPNTINDAKEMASMLKNIGFIIYGDEPQINLTYREFYDTITDFQSSIETGDMVLFYFAGHGTQWEEQNYLISVDNFREQKKNGVIENVALSGSDLKRLAINAQDLLNEINDKKPFVTMFFLDCCRTYPLRNVESQQNARGEQINYPQGLKPMIVNAGSLIAFACPPGTVADDGNNKEQHGLFTKYLLKHFKTPNEDIRFVMADVTHDVSEESKDKQIPHITLCLKHKHIFLYNENQGMNCILRMT
ncbi:hypothetical protein I4U23_006059 [Adineta vaga]|nr:hypothetical protein I4U23_006059 [Adineta vaga]